jgi:hypothetical protein
MPKALWFAFGFTVALLLLVALVMGPLMNIIADHAPRPVAPADWVPPTPPTPQPTSVPADEPAPVPTMPAVRLTWQREGGFSGRCDRLEIDGLSQVSYARCADGPRLAYLTQAELEQFLLYMARYASFDYSIQENPGLVTQATVRVSFAGRGGREASSAEQAEVARWAAALYERMAQEEQQADTVALARLHLAGRRGITPDDVVTRAVEAVTWPDACLGLRASGVFCAQVLTPGYRIILEVDGTTYEYRADTHRVVRAVEASGSMVLPPAVAPAPQE